MWQARDRAAQDQDSGDLRELRGLNGHEAKVEPPPGAVYLGSYARYEDEDEAYQYDQVQGRGIFAPRCIPDSAGHEEGGDAEYHVPDAFEQKIGPNFTVRSRIDHDEPQHGEAERHQEQVGPQATHRPTVPWCPARSLANPMNASPLSAYPGNWSKLAHPGESRTTSPGLASSVALSTAFSRSGVLWTTFWKPSSSR